MRLDNIEVATNGFILEEYNGNRYIARTLTEAATIAGEGVPVYTHTGYSAGFDAHSLMAVKSAARAGQKISAIKLLRDCFTPRLGLKEAKELVEILCF